MKLFKKEEGFTLVELMVVVLIIGILVAIAIPVFNAARESAQRRTCQANLRTLDGAIQQWAADEVGNDPGALADAAAAETALADFVKVWPACPTDDSAYTYDNATETFACPHAVDLQHSY